jgi:PAS domain S-box-containing protein
MKENLQILHLEDDDLDAEIIKNTLQQERIVGDITRASCKKEYFSTIHRNDYDIILCDNSLPDYDGISALKYAREHKPNIPFIFVSGTMGEERAVDALRYGANDYVLKQHLNKLAPAIQRIMHEVETEHASKENEIKYRSFFENSMDAILLASADEKIFSANPAACIMLGYSEEELFELGRSSIVEMTDPQLPILLSERALNGKAYGELTFIRKDGTHFPGEISSAIFKDQNGLECTSMIIRDIAERKRAEKELVEAKKKAEEMNHLKNCFLSNMSHELRTPLISVLGFAELLQQELNDPEHLEFVRNIMEGGQRLNNTLTGILEISKLEATIASFKLQPLCLADEIKATVKLFLPMAQSKRLFLKTELSDTYLNAQIDSELFGKALFQLISNGIKFTKEGGVIVTLNQKRKQNQDWAVTKVKDTGIGISKENLNIIFTEFKQASEGHGRSHEGIGLGLTIAKKIVELMKGYIEVDSDVGQGSVLSIWLPAIPDENQIHHQIEEKLVSIIDKPPTTNEIDLIKVLVVDDNSSNRLFINRCLMSNLRIIEAENGISSVVFASKEHFDLILMDINLGAGIDGVQAMYQIRKIPRYARVPIIAITAYAMLGDEDRFLSMGFDDYLAKPFTKDVLVSLVEKCLAKVKRGIEIV